MIAESEEMPYECAPRQKAPFFFEEPVTITAGRWYVAWARVSGPSSDCGSSGQIQVASEDGIQFHFKSSRKSNNGTDVNAGQIPQLLYKVVNANEAKSGTGEHRKQEPAQPISILSSKFAKTVTAEGFQVSASSFHGHWAYFYTTALPKTNVLKKSAFYRLS